jgi:hypothetical protein
MVRRGKGGQKSRTNRTRNVSPDKFLTIERIWAEHGVVRVEDKKGKISTMTVRDAALRAEQINSAKIPGWHKEQQAAFINKIVEVCREAQRQLENPKDVTDEAIANVLQGKTAEGKEIPAPTTEDKILETWKFRYPSMTYEELRTIYREGKLDDGRKHQLMSGVNDARIREMTPALPRAKQ